MPGIRIFFCYFIFNLIFSFPPPLAAAIAAAPCSYHTQATISEFSYFKKREPIFHFLLAGMFIASYNVWSCLLFSLLAFCCESVVTKRLNWKCFQTLYTIHQGGISCGAIDEPKKSSKAIDERVIIIFRDKNVVIARFRDKNVVIARFRDKNVVIGWEILPLN